MNTNNNTSTHPSGIERYRQALALLSAHSARVHAMVARANAHGIAPLRLPAIRQALRAALQALVELEASQLPRAHARGVYRVA